MKAQAPWDRHTDGGISNNRTRVALVRDRTRLPVTSSLFEGSTYGKQTVFRNLRHMIGECVFPRHDNSG